MGDYPDFLKKNPNPNLSELGVNHFQSLACYKDFFSGYLAAISSDFANRLGRVQLFRSRCRRLCMFLVCRSERVRECTGRGEVQKIYGELCVPLEVVAFQPPRVIPGEVELFLPLCQGISAPLMVHKATHCEKKAIFTGLAVPAPDAGRRRGPFRKPHWESSPDALVWGPQEPVLLGTVSSWGLAYFSNQMSYLWCFSPSDHMHTLHAALAAIASSAPVPSSLQCKHAEGLWNTAK